MILNKSIQLDNELKVLEKKYYDAIQNYKQQYILETVDRSENFSKCSDVIIFDIPEEIELLNKQHN